MQELKLGEYSGIVGWQGVGWAAKRMAQTTLSLDIRASHAQECPPAFDLDATSLSIACLSDLRCFSFEGWPHIFSDVAVLATEVFHAWVLEQAPNIDALWLLGAGQHPDSGQCLAAYVRHLKHLEVQARAFLQGVSHLAWLLPNLETVYLHGSGEYFDDDEINLI